MPVTGEKEGEMPKETITDIAGCFDVKVGWSRDGHLQLATEMRSPTTSDAPTNLRELVQGWSEDATDPEQPDGAMGLWATLDRTAVNDLIRVLRKARDQAFGRDE